MKAIFSFFTPRGTPWGEKRKNALHFDVFLDPKIRLNPRGYPDLTPKKHLAAHGTHPICSAHPFGTPRNPTQFQRRPLFANFKNPSKSRTPSGMDCVILKDSLRSVSASLRLTSRFETLFKTLKGTASEIFD